MVADVRDVPQPVLGDDKFVGHARQEGIGLDRGCVVVEYTGAVLALRPGSTVLVLPPRVAVIVLLPRCAVADADDLLALASLQVLGIAASGTRGGVFEDVVSHPGILP